MLIRLPAALLLQQGPPSSPLPPGQASPEIVSRITTSVTAWVLVAALAVVAAYFLIRLVEMDLTNEETPNQDDPFV